MNTTAAAHHPATLAAATPRRPRYPASTTSPPCPPPSAASGSSSARCARPRPSSPRPSSSASCCRGSWPRSSRPTPTRRGRSRSARRSSSPTWLTTVLAAITGHAAVHVRGATRHAGRRRDRPAGPLGDRRRQGRDRVLLRAGRWASPGWPPATSAPCSAASTPATRRACRPPRRWGLLLTVDGAPVRPGRRHDRQARRAGHLDRARLGARRREPDPGVRPAEAVPPACPSAPPTACSASTRPATPPRPWRSPSTRAQDAVLFGGYVVAALTIGTVLLYRRDPN